MPAVTVPDPALVVLSGASGSGKSTWAAARYRPSEIVSSDQLRDMVWAAARTTLMPRPTLQALLDQIVAARLRRGLHRRGTPGLDAERRRAHLALARQALCRVAVLFGTGRGGVPPEEQGAARPVPSSVLTASFVARPTRDRDCRGRLGGRQQQQARRSSPPHSAGSRAAAAQQRSEPAELSLVLQISRFPWGDDPAAWLAAVAAAAADAGLSGIALMDHLIQIPQVGPAWEPIPEPWVTLGMLAGVTPGLRLGTLVSPVTFRAPGVLAKAMATLDVLSGGQAFCGLGAGWWEREHAAFGLPFPPANERFDQLETAIETLRALWGQGTRAYAGDRVRLPETTCYPRPISAIPIIVGGSGERRTLDIAARLADGCNLRPL